MDLDFTEEQEMLRDSLRGLCEAESDSQAVRRAEIDPTGVMQRLWRSLADSGFLGLGIAEEHGGSGLGLIEASVAAHEFGRALAPVPHFESSIFAARLIAAAGRAEQQAQWLPPLADGSLVIVPAFYETGGNDDIETVHLAPMRSGDGLVLSGRKCFVGYANLADRLLVLLRHPDRDHEHVLACIDARARGVSVAVEPNLASAALCTVDFDAVEIADGDLMAPEGGVAAIWSRAFLEGLVPLAAQAVGGAQRTLELAIAYAKEREQFDRPIGSFQAIAHYLADAATELEAARVLVWQAAWAHGEEGDFERLAITAKLFACRAFRRISALSIQVHGGLGFTTEADPQLYFRRAKHQQLLHGESGWLEAQLARRVIAGEIPVLN
ncbi:acyl-CoA dehydrogenase family protein [Sphingomonas sp. C3-2]|uniref:acyl-CoA dehydrogenase family protein n=1 Tax=Sphingomonas sp. C3-2 TaxID=3062169 RepID=UPI00294B183A|nr:acyl-CoA dehydrogenase family protein [Sphingomonas sp. C3-2]WOK36726.1 acyl-CoA dehydrogenase family protein [Sphingomonas sp. C3-2]